MGLLDAFVWSLLGGYSMGSLQDHRLCDIRYYSWTRYSRYVQHSADYHYAEAVNGSDHRRDGDHCTYSYLYSEGGRDRMFTITFREWEQVLSRLVVGMCPTFL
jgi:hypothetical protein